uniref:von Willebrand factor A domain-containing protein 8 n=1 Tax=Macrostomum lignano TaxID=282301 RepID=A0A1I8FUD4_9PLAT
MSIVRNGADGFIKIGNVIKTIRKSKSPHLIPVNYLPEPLSATLSQHLQWILQKDVLGQDVFLIGPPGKSKRQLALMYSELAHMEVEYISLSRDVTESDLKQRREIRAGSAVYADECAVRAALEGRLLVLEGLEKAERNVLPVLNNLLENREVQLEDGRFIMHPSRYDFLLGKHGSDTMREWRLLRCSPDFRVIALGLPVPRYRGNPLDPPLRSRFQCRRVPAEPALPADRPPSDKLLQLTSFGMAINAEEARSLGLPDFPLDNLAAVAELWNLVPAMPVQYWLQRLYPFEGALGREAADAVKQLAKKFELPTQLDHASQIAMLGLTASQSAAGDNSTSQSAAGEATVSIRIEAALLSKRVDLKVPTGPWPLLASSKSDGCSSGGGFVNTRYHSGLLADLMVTHAGGQDFALIGPRGCGKFTVACQLARQLGYPLAHVVLYRDMSSRDLLQQRVTDAEGDTQWRPSALVQAAVAGHLAVLDGLHRVDRGTFAVLHRLLGDRELALFDGTRLLRHDRYDRLKADHGWSDSDMAARRLLRIHPGFRVVGLGELSPAKQQANQWLSDEMLTAFLFHSVRALSADEEAGLLMKLVPNSQSVEPSVKRLVGFAHRLRDSSDPSHVSLAGSLSTRQLLRLSRCVAADPQVNLRELLERACLSRFLPRLAAQTLAQCLDEADFKPPDSAAAEQPITCSVSSDGTRIHIGSASAHLPPELRNEMKIPETLFYDNQTHMRVLEAMLRDFSIGEHLLLIGNQGVGKNKLADHFLRLLRRPREYVQLHRDTTVHSLTLQPTVLDGRIAFQDSPLVRACRFGHVLVVDEADKAPTHVTCVLKTLAESGEMALPDGRRIVPAGWAGPQSPGVIRTHPDFRLLVLANRPGFPFLGNDFFGALGDTFACHPVDNPQLDSELHMLAQYGPDVPQQVLQKLVSMFADLRAMSDEGNLQYPYSTRELVNIVRHLQKFPGERLSSVLQNVFDFDSHNPELRSTLADVLTKHGIPAESVGHHNVKLSKQLPLPSPVLLGSSNLLPANRFSPFLTAAQSQFHLKGPADLPVSSIRLDGGSGRSEHFSELESFACIPLDDTDGLADICVTCSDDGSHRLVHLATINPVRVYSMVPGSRTAKVLDFTEIFPDTGHFYKPRVHLLSLEKTMPHCFLLHEEMTNVLLLVDAGKRQVSRVKSQGLPEHPLASGRNLWRRPTLAKGSSFRLADSLGLDGSPVMFQQGRDHVELLDLRGGWSLSLQLPAPISNLQPLSETSWIVQFVNNDSQHILLQSPQELHQFSLLQLEQPELLPQKIQWACPLSTDLPSLRVQPETQLSAVSAAGGGHLSVLSLAPPNAEGLHQLSLHRIDSLTHKPPAAAAAQLHDVSRPLPAASRQARTRDPMFGSGSGGLADPRFSQFCLLPDGRSLVRCRPTDQVPPEAFGNRQPAIGTAGVLELTDLAASTVSYLPVEPPGPAVHRLASRPASWLVSDLPRLLAQTAGGDLVSADQSGSVCFWQVAPAGLETALAEWRRLLGDEKSALGGGSRQMLIERQLPPGSSSLSGPKQGKVDPTGAPHVGGNMWAGGTGGRDTAGLGGVGGPYRLDAGHHVYQVPDEIKRAVPPEISEAAREMARKAWRERLREIEMSEHDGELYDTYLRRVRPQVSSLRAMLQSLEAKGKERDWLRHQGDLDDGKLVEGLVGERAVYRRRGERPPELGTPPEKPKLLRVLVDVSGSMYRFNGTDQRLERQLEACLMLMEAFEGFETKFAYEFRGHSGEGPDWNFTSAVRPPANQKQRLDALKAMLAHSQFCMSGDHTVEAIDCGVRQLATAEADERFLVVFSDANLDRYGIHPKQLSRALTQDARVTACAIFLGTLGNQATFLRESLPSGHAFVCLDNASLPHILQQFFTSTLLATD